MEAWLWITSSRSWRGSCRFPLRAFKQWLSDRSIRCRRDDADVFIVPVIPLFPLKLVGFWLLTHEYWLSGL